MQFLLIIQFHISFTQTPKTPFLYPKHFISLKAPSHIPFLFQSRLPLLQSRDVPHRLHIRHGHRLPHLPAGGPSTSSWQRWCGAGSWGALWPHHHAGAVRRPLCHRLPHGAVCRGGRSGHILLLVHPQHDLAGGGHSDGVWACRCYSHAVLAERYGLPVVGLMLDCVQTFLLLV